MSTEQLQELGPIDYTIRILDLAFLVKAEDGSVAAVRLG